MISKTGREGSYSIRMKPKDIEPEDQDFLLVLYNVAHGQLLQVGQYNREEGELYYFEGNGERIIEWKDVECWSKAYVTLKGG